MIFEGDFFFHGMPRWNLGWATPNYAGAFLATLLPWCWAWRQQWASVNQRVVSIALIAVELGGWFLLCKTYSRGALIAAAVAVLWWSGARWWSNRDKVRTILSESGTRFAVVALLLVLTGFIGRITPAYTQADESIGNRLDLWRGGLEMIASSPWAGWGAGESGRAYMNWFQPVGDTEVFTTMVNSYLHVAVEHGLFVLCGALVLLFAVLIWAWRKASSGDVLAGVAGASLFAWAVANVFTTLWIEPKLWIVPGIAIAVIIWGEGGRGPVAARWLSSVVSGVSIAVAISLLLYAVGTRFAQRHSWKVVPESDGTTALISRTTSPARLPVWHVWPDTAVFGPTPGQELRRWAEAYALELHVYRPTDRKLSEYAIEGGLVLSGNQAERLGRDPIPAGIRQLWLLHPSPIPPASTSVSADRSRSPFPEVVVVLPAIDETGLNAAWHTWAEHAKARVAVSRNSGLDLRGAWPKIAPEGTRTRS